MAKREVTKDTLRAIARMSGFELSDEKLDELLPQVQRSMEALVGLNALELDNVEPAVVFRPEVEK